MGRNMSYTSIGYYLLLAVILLAYYIVPGRIRWTVLLAGSLYFYWLLTGNEPESSREKGMKRIKMKAGYGIYGKMVKVLMNPDPHRRPETVEEFRAAMRKDMEGGA